MDISNVFKYSEVRSHYNFKLKKIITDQKKNKVKGDTTDLKINQIENQPSLVSGEAIKKKKLT